MFEYGDRTRGDKKDVGSATYGASSATGTDRDQTATTAGTAAGTTGQAPGKSFSGGY
jgi:hypothetical protein